MTKIRTDFARNIQIIVDDQSDVRAACDGQNRFRHCTDFIGRGFFGAELDQIGAAVAELLRDNFRRAAMQIGRVNEGIKPAIREWFHEMILTTKDTKDTKDVLFPIGRASRASLPKQICDNLRNLRILFCVFRLRQGYGGQAAVKNYLRKFAQFADKTFVPLWFIKKAAGIPAAV